MPQPPPSFLSLSCVSLPCSLTLSSPVPLVFPFSPSFCPYLFHCCLSFSTSVWSLSVFFFCILPPSCPPPHTPPLHPSVSTRQRVIHLHWGDTCAVLTVRALTEREEGKQQPHDSKDTLSVGKHIRPSITEASNSTNTLGISYCHQCLAQ